MLHIPTFCDLCSRLYVDNKKGTVCEAFPDGIPSKFLFDGEEHDQPFNQKNDLVFNARADVSKQAVEELKNFLIEIRRRKK